MRKLTLWIDPIIHNCIRFIFYHVKISFIVRLLLECTTESITPPIDCVHAFFFQSDSRLIWMWIHVFHIFTAVLTNAMLRKNIPINHVSLIRSYPSLVLHTVLFLYIWFHRQYNLRCSLMAARCKTLFPVWRSWQWRFVQEMDNQT